MTKKELWDEIKNHLNDTEIETLGITSRSTKEELQSIYDQSLHVHRSKPMVTPEKRGNETRETGTELEEEIKRETPEPAKESETETVETPEEKEPEPVETPEEKEPGETSEPPGEPVGETDFDELLGKIAGADVPHSAKSTERPILERKKRKQSKKQSEPDSTRIEGYVLLTIVDVVYPFTLSWLNNLLDKKGKRISASDLQLAEKDFNKLEPLADQAADYLAININPIAAFFLVATFMYANNLIAVKFSIENK